MERYSIEFLKKMDGQEDKHPVEPMRAWENMSDQKMQSAIGFNLSCDWSGMWRKFSKLIPGVKHGDVTTTSSLKDNLLTAYCIFLIQRRRSKLDLL